MAGFMARFLETPLIGGDKPDGPAAALVERVRATRRAAAWWAARARRARIASRLPRAADVLPGLFDADSLTRPARRRRLRSR
jgi:hypothetical protein